jgi:hypothetical protein
VFAFLVVSSLTMAQEQGVVKPQLLLSEVVQGMPKGERQEVRVLTANFQPRDKTLFPYTPLPSNCLCLGRRIHIGNGGTRASHGESWSSADDAGARKDDGLQPQQHRPVALGDL